MSLNLGQVILADDGVDDTRIRYVNVLHDRFVDRTVENRIVITSETSVEPVWRTEPLTNKECFRLARLFLDVAMDERYW